MRALRTLTRRFAASDRGLAAVEFAMVIPFLLLMMLATFDAGRAVAAYMKVKAATFTLASMTNQFTTGTLGGITTTTMGGITGSSAKVLSPYTGTTVARITQIKATSTNGTSVSAATVSWSYATDSSAYTQGSTWQLANLPTQFTSNNACNSFPCYLIYAEMTYTFTPTFGYFLTGSIVLSDNVWVTPRSSACIQYNSVPATC